MKKITYVMIAIVSFVAGYVIGMKRESHKCHLKRYLIENEINQIS